MAETSSRRNDDRGGAAAVEFERECVLFFEEVVQIFGVPKSVGQIYGVLYASPLPLSFTDIVERLEISKGSASQGLQLLRSLGAISETDWKRSVANDTEIGSSKVGVPRSSYKAGDPETTRRVTFYRPELSLRRLVSGVLQQQVKPFATAGTTRMAHLRRLAEECGNGSSFYLDRVRQLGTWRRKFKTVVPILNAFLGPI